MKVLLMKSDTKHLTAHRWLERFPLVISQVLNCFAPEGPVVLREISHAHHSVT
jgi:hypothetical protein